MKLPVLYGNFDIFFFWRYKMVRVHNEKPLQTSINNQKNQITEWLPCVCTFLVFSSSFMVMFPVPGPTSRTTSVGRSADCNQRIHRSTTRRIILQAIKTHNYLHLHECCGAVHVQFSFTNTVVQAKNPLLFIWIKDAIKLVPFFIYAAVRSNLIVALKWCREKNSIQCYHFESFEYTLQYQIVCPWLKV